MIKTKFLTRFVAVVAMLSTVTACNNDIVNEYCNYKARLVYYGATTVLQPLNDALKNDNTFAMVSMPDNTAATYQLKAQLYGQGAAQITVALEGAPLPMLGLDNGRGFIIGRSAWRSDNPYVFDRVCPNCYKEHRDIKYVLNFTNNKDEVKCGTCKRTYSLINGGLVTAGENGDKLFRYRVTAYNPSTPSITVYQ